MQAEILPSHKIDEKKWEECLMSASNSLVYASYNYLNIIADNWSAFILDDYKYIMPVAWRKKLGIKYCYNIPFVQQLGVFGKDVDASHFNACYNLLMQNFKYGDYAFNYKNINDKGASCTNYVLSLASNYISTSSFYTDKLRNDLSKLTNSNLEYSVAEADETINLYHELYGDRFAHITDADYKKFYEICVLKESENNLVARKVLSGKNIVAINLLLKDKRRLYNIMSCTTTDGRSMLAGHFLHDNLIKEFSQTGLVLDFEGSDIPGVGHFYKSFGAINQPYTRVHFNNLPKVLQLLKR